MRASLGSDRLTEYHAPVGCPVINPAGVDSRLAWSATRENAVIVRKILVAELVSVAGVSPNHFIARFATTFGMPPHRYMINLRLDFAEKLLLDGELAIAEVAYLAGFLNQSHLAPMKKYRGRTPRTAYASARN
ncbi:helix-turn-helix transcriptional regulator [Mesorhizobium sangaii]|uniref:AraC-like DNA-binding protein n=1 Tax=Mesorhizobium sangaii TaxID=505389 RepID=A0A841PK21_9HYPH|nr:AraC family transcriptional regulator [Mesorhizobium sangaii]MBB6413008.1 AraC-like DNA-binding protein [Mesorhizobium sangaii]